MIFIPYIIGQIFPNLFNNSQIASYRSSMMLNKVSSLWFIENLQIPFKLILFIFFYILIFFKALICQIFTILMEAGLKWFTTTCHKILKSFLLKERSIFNFLVIPKINQTIESIRVVNFVIYLQSIIAFCFKFFYNCSIPLILQLLCSFIWILPTHF